jgi:hypothetical protein
VEYELISQFCLFCCGGAASWLASFWAIYILFSSDVQLFDHWKRYNMSSFLQVIFFSLHALRGSTLSRNLYSTFRFAYLVHIYTSLALVAYSRTVSPTDLTIALHFFCPSIYSLCLPLWYLQTCGHCIICSSLIYSLWLPLWYLQTCGHCIICPSSIYSLWLPGGAFGIFKHFLCDYFIRTKNEEKPKPLTYLVLLHNDFM